MHRILFVCHGNICRSTMAQFVMAHLVKKAGLESEFAIDSKGTSAEELGNPPHPGTVRRLNQAGIPVLAHRASQMSGADYGRYDLIIGMDSWNLRNILAILGGDPDGKVSLLLDFTGRPRDIADPWYTHNFDETFNDVMEGCEALLGRLSAK